MTTLDDIRRLQTTMAKLPQLELKTEHYFSGPDVYGRRLFQPAGSTLVGKMHKRAHLFVLLEGELTVASDGQLPIRIKAHRVLESPAGVKRAIYAHTDSSYVTVHRTQETDVEAIERELIEPDDTALCDAHNRLKLDVPAFRALTAQVISAEKPGFWSDWTPEQQALYSRGDWREFSRSRGYSEEEIADYARWLDMVAQAQAAGLNPYFYIHDLATEAAMKNLKRDTHGEILKSSHLPFERR
jgi:quercetin dioxygenase-like cupin family protein